MFLSLKSFSRYYLAIFFFAFLLYGNSIKNYYALDDEMVTLNNSRVEMGLKGIPKILKTFHSIDEKSHYEYRPLVLISFAIEYEFFGRNPHISHFINVLIYALTCLMIFYLLGNLFYSIGKQGELQISKNPNISGHVYIFPFLATLLFAAHPLHTEVVDNLKSRDDLLSFFNSILALIFFIKFAETEYKRFAFWGFLFLLFAILSKKTAVVFILIIPMALYFSGNLSWKKIVLVGILAAASFLTYIVLKKIMISEKPLRIFNYFENPLFFEPGLWKSVPAGLYAIWKYIELLIFPHPLSFYYGFNQVPIAGWTHPLVWISLVFHLAIFISAVFLFKKKHIISFAVLFYLFSLFPFSNIVLPVVGIIAERFVYVASLGFCIVLAFLMMKLFRIPLSVQTAQTKISKSHPLSFPFFLFFSSAVLILYSFKTITRNPDWKDHLTLYRHDIKHLDQSAKAHAIISNTIYPKLFSMTEGIQKQNLIKECILHYKKSLEIYPDYIVSNNNLGSIYFTFLGDYKTAALYFEHAVKLDTNYLEAFYNLAYSYEKLGKKDSAIVYFEKALQIKPDYKPAYDQLYPLYFSEFRYDKAIEVNLRAAEFIPELSAVYFVNAGNVFSAKNDTVRALNYFIKAFEKEPGNFELCNHIGKVYQKINNAKSAEEYFRKAEEIQKNK